jgi:hypothetical protein
MTPISHHRTRSPDPLTGHRYARPIVRQLHAGTAHPMRAGAQPRASGGPAPGRDRRPRVA